MRASLVSREVIADSIELVARGNRFDGLVVLVGCDKTIPGGVDGAGAARTSPALLLYGGSIAPGHFHGHDVTIQDVFEAVGAHAAGTMSDAEFCDARGRRLSRAPAPAAASSPPTRWRSPASSSASPRSAAAACRRPIRSKADVARAAGELVMEPGARGVRPRDIITRTALENAIASVAATGGSTNAVLHLLAIAREAGVPLELDDFDRISARTPLLADLKPAGRFVATDLHAAGGSPLVAQAAARGRTLIDGDGADRHRPHARRRSRRRATETPGQEVVRPLGQPLKPTGGLVILHGNLAPDGCVVKISGTERMTPSRAGARLRQRGSRIRRGPAPDDQGRRRRRHPLRRAERRAGHARDARRHRRDRRRRPRRLGRADHRRPLLRRDARLHGRPRRARSRARRPDRRRPRRRHHRRSTSTARELDVEVCRRETIAQRLARVDARRRRATRTGVFAKYAKLVSSASQGAVTGATIADAATGPICETSREVTV